MRYRYITQKRSGEHVIVGYRLVAEKGSPQTPLDIERPPRNNILDDRNRPRYAMHSDGTIYEREIIDTPQEIRDAQNREIQRRIRQRYTVNDELAILRRALINGVTDEARDYSSFVEQTILDVRAGDAHGEL